MTEIVAVASYADLKPGQIPAVFLEPTLPGPYTVSLEGSTQVLVERYDDNGAKVVVWRGKDWNIAGRIRERLNALSFLRGE